MKFELSIIRYLLHGSFVLVNIIPTIQILESGTGHLPSFSLVNVYLTCVVCGVALVGLLKVYFHINSALDCRIEKWQADRLK